MDVSDDKISNSVKMSVPSICRTADGGAMLSSFLLGCEIRCGRAFSEASWDCLNCQHPWLGWKELVAFFRTCSASRSHAWLYVLLVINMIFKSRICEN